LKILQIPVLCRPIRAFFLICFEHDLDGTTRMDNLAEERFSL
jgi:hypothetical protein